MPDQPRILPLAENALTVDFGNEISVAMNERAISLAKALEESRFPGFIEAVPAYSSISIFYDLPKVARHLSGFANAFEAVRDRVVATLHQTDLTPRPPEEVVEIDVDFSDDVALDLETVASRTGLSKSAVIDLFIVRTYRVFMLGFLPGFAYMGEVDERIAVPRLDNPRLKVPKGSVGIAGQQTGIYPLESPGGWQIIGRTDLAMFTPEAALPCPLKPGDRVKFVSR